jgi:outer membrane protein TolC
MRRCWLAAAVLLVPPGVAHAQTAAARAITLIDAMQLAVQHYPAVRESQARAQAAADGIGEAETAYLPKLNLLWQENRATRNNVFGLRPAAAGAARHLWPGPRDALDGQRLGKRSRRAAVMGRR